MSPDKSWYERIPKVELHLHLEGAIPCAALWELVRKYGGDPTLPDIQALKNRFVYTNFQQFIATWVWKNKFLHEYDDFTYIAEAVAQDLARQNIRYAEIFYSPPDLERHGLQAQELTVAIRKGLSHQSEIDIALVADLVRDSGPESAMATLTAVSEVIDLGVVGVGMGGSELSYPAEDYSGVYERARLLGFHTTVHSGEVGSAERKMFGNSLASEYRALVERFGFTFDDINALVLNGVTLS